MKLPWVAVFPLHGHRDMEIITYVRQGVLGHRDSLGSEGIIQTGDIQIMSAGTGIRHAEVQQRRRPFKLYQVWLFAARAWRFAAMGHAVISQGQIVPGASSS